MKIAFCTSLRARALSRDWAYHTWLLERTVASMLAQTGVDVAVIVGCHDVPDTHLTSDPRVRFERVSIGLPARNFDDMSADKVVKHSIAARHAIDLGADYVIFNDADDLVSNRVGAYVAANRGARGWYSQSQWFYTYGGRLTRLSPIRLPKSGPFVMVRAECLQFDAPPFSGEWMKLVEADGEHDYLALLARHALPVCTLAAAGHGHYPLLMQRLGQPLEPLPFAANLVINHPDSMSTAPGTHGYALLSRLGALRRSLRFASTLRPMSQALKYEFHVPADPDIPTAYRGGSVFWR